MPRLLHHCICHTHTEMGMLRNKTIFFTKIAVFFTKFTGFFINSKILPISSGTFQSLHQRSAGCAGLWPADVCHTFQRPHPTTELTPARHWHGICESRNLSARDRRIARPFSPLGRRPTSSNLKITLSPVWPLMTDFSFVFWDLICVLCFAYAQR